MTYYPPPSFHFSVDFSLGDNRDAQFQEVQGLSMSLGTEDLVEGGENRFVHRLPTRGSFGNLILKRGLVTGSELTVWVLSAIEDFDITPKDVDVKLLNEEGQPLIMWKFVKAWPLTWSLSDLKSQESAVAIETMELAYQFFKRI